MFTFRNLFFDDGYVEQSYVDRNYLVDAIKDQYDVIPITIFSNLHSVLDVTPLVRFAGRNPIVVHLPINLHAEISRRSWYCSIELDEELVCDHFVGILCIPIAEPLPYLRPSGT